MCWSWTHAHRTKQYPAVPSTSCRLHGKVAFKHSAILGPLLLLHCCCSMLSGRTPS